MDLLLDTQVLVWTASGDSRLSEAGWEAIRSPSSDIFVSAVTAFEFVDLERRGRFPPDVSFEPILRALAAVVLDLPAETWRIAAGLPPIHADPVDRMVVAHAILGKLTLVTADHNMQLYPVPICW